MNTEREGRARALIQKARNLCSWVPALAALGRDDKPRGWCRSQSYPRPSNPPYNPLTALRRRDRVATGTMWEGRAAPVVRFGRFRPAEPRGSRYVRPTGTTGLPLVETALRVGCSPLASAGTRRPHAGEWKSEIINRRAGRLRGATNLTLRGTLQAPRSLFMREEVTNETSLGPERAAGWMIRVPRRRGTLSHPKSGVPDFGTWKGQSGSIRIAGRAAAAAEWTPAISARLQQSGRLTD